MKSHTDISQSKKLAEILPLESADMMYHSVEDEYGSGAFVATSKIITNGLKNDDFHIDDIPCWSLAALLSVIPNPIIGTHFVTHKWEGESNKVVNHQDGLMEIEQLVSTEGFDNPVDACYEMILKLHKQNLI